MTKKHIKNHIKYYSTLAVMQIAGLALLILLYDKRDLQMLVVIMISAAYASWAIAHHYIHHSLNTKIVLEYVMFGIFGIIVTLLYFK